MQYSIAVIMRTVRQIGCVQRHKLMLIDVRVYLKFWKTDLKRRIVLFGNVPWTGRERFKGLSALPIHALSGTSMIHIRIFFYKIRHFNTLKRILQIPTSQPYPTLIQLNNNLSWCWQTRTTRLLVSRGQQAWYHAGSIVAFRYSNLKRHHAWQCRPAISHIHSSSEL